MPNYLYKKALEYTKLKIGNTTLNVPYMINDHSRFCSKKTKGKGTPSQIKSEFLQKTKTKKIKISKLDTNQIKKLMLKWGIGIDCSGIVYNLVDSWLKHENKPSLSKKAKRPQKIKALLDKIIPQKNRVFQIGAEILLSKLNTYTIHTTGQAKIGDFISTTTPNWPTKHIMLIVKIKNNQITYIQSSDNYTDKNGNHFGVCKFNGARFGHIKIINKNEGLEKQQWQEQTIDNKNFGKTCFLPKKGNAIKRLNWLK